MRAERRGTERAGGDKYFIRHSSVHRFALEHPNEYDLAKVDKLWFIDLISQGKAVWLERASDAPTRKETVHAE